MVGVGDGGFHGLAEAVAIELCLVVVDTDFPCFIFEGDRAAC